MLAPAPGRTPRREGEFDGSKGFVEAVKMCGVHGTEVPRQCQYRPRRGSEVQARRAAVRRAINTSATQSLIFGRFTEALYSPQNSSGGTIARMLLS